MQMKKLIKEKFYYLFDLKQRYDRLQEQKRTLNSQINNYINLDSVATISQELIERDMCMVDSALVRPQKNLVTDSNLLFINHVASQSQLSKSTFPLSEKLGTRYHESAI
jgi:hypothetical protein